VSKNQQDSDEVSSKHLDSLNNCRRAVSNVLRQLNKVTLRTCTFRLLGRRATRVAYQRSLLGNGRQSRQHLAHTQTKPEGAQESSYHCREWKFCTCKKLLTTYTWWQCWEMVQRKQWPFHQPCSTNPQTFSFRTSEEGGFTWKKWPLNSSSSNKGWHKNSATGHC